MMNKVIAPIDACFTFLGLAIGVGIGGGVGAAIASVVVDDEPDAKAERRTASGTVDRESTTAQNVHPETLPRDDDKDAEIKRLSRRVQKLEAFERLEEVREFEDPPSNDDLPPLDNCIVDD